MLVPKFCKKSLGAVVLITLVCVSRLVWADSESQVWPWGETIQGGLGQIDFFFSPAPDAQQPIIDAIDHAQKNIKMMMFHMSNPTVASAMMFAAKRGVEVRIIFDKNEWKNPNDVKLVDDMKAAGVQIQQASAGFSITHCKAMTVDGQKAMISTMNETRAFMRMVDIGVFVYDKSVIAEMDSVFEMDWANAQNQGKETPTLTNSYLVWSPVNSSAKIVSYIQSAKNEIALMVENLGHPEISNALMDAAARGVAVRVLVPKCNLVKVNLNYPFVQGLRQGKVDAKMFPGPSSDQLPYLHAKFIVVDEQSVMLGSENYSVNSLNFAREVGIIIPDASVAVKAESLFNQLWPKGELPPADPNYTCAAAPGNPVGVDDIIQENLKGFVNRITIH